MPTFCNLLIYLFIYVFIYLSIYLFNYLIICLFIYSFIYLFIYLSIFYACVCLFVCMYRTPCLFTTNLLSHQAVKYIVCMGKRTNKTSNWVVRLFIRIIDPGRLPSQKSPANLLLGEDRASSRRKTFELPVATVFLAPLVAVVPALQGQPTHS